LHFLKGGLQKVKWFWVGFSVFEKRGRTGAAMPDADDAEAEVVGGERVGAGLGRKENFFGGSWHGSCFVLAKNTAHRVSGRTTEGQ
jgi:hypothetical protein